MNNHHHFAARTIRSIIEFLLYSSLYLAIMAFSGAAVAGEALGASFNLAAYLLPALVALAGYTFDSMSGMRGEADRLNQPGRYQYFQRYWRISLILALVSLIAIILISLRKSLFLGIGLVALPVVMVSLYSLGWKRLFPKAKLGRLKDNTFAKPLATGLVWGVIEVLVPAFYLNLPFNLWLLLLYGYLSWRVMFNCIICDIADMEGDRESGTRTFPVVYGTRKTVAALFLANVLSFGWVALMSGLTLAPRIALCAGILYAFGYLYLSTRVRDRRIISLAVDGEFALTYLVFLLLQLFLHSAVG